MILISAGTTVRFQNSTVLFILVHSHLRKGMRFLELRDRVGTHIVSHFLPSLYRSLHQPLQHRSKGTQCNNHLQRATKTTFCL